MVQWESQRPLPLPPVPPYRKRMLKHVLRLGALLVVIAVAVVIYLAWPDTAQVPFDKITGKRPQISAPRIQTLPTVKVADVIGWQEGQTPVPAAGLAVKAFAKNLDHPRWLYRLQIGRAHV